MNFKYRMLRFLSSMARFLPLRLGNLLAEFGGDVLFLFSKGRRTIVGDNIKHVPGVKPDKGGQRRVVRSVFKNMSKNYFELTKLPQMKLENVEEKVTIEGWHHLVEAISDAKGTIIASAHLGNFDLAVRVLALRGVDLTIFVEAFEATPFLRNVARLREKLGGSFLPVGTKSLKNGLQILKSGGTMGIVCDRDIQGNGLKVKFFGEETALPLGAVSLALHTGAAIIPMFSVRKSRTHHSIYIEPPLRVTDTNDHSHTLRESLEKFAAIMEKYIRQYPEQWVVLDRIWKPSSLA